MNINNIPEYFIWFIIYSFLGWAWETLITSIPQRRFVNRGFLNGPYCPIYGAGALLFIFFTNNIDSIAVRFILGAVIACTLEYLTSWVLELVVFGLGAVVAPYFHQNIANITAQLSPAILNSIFSIILIAFIVDVVITNRALSKFNRILREYQKAIDKRRLDFLEFIRRGRRVFEMRIGKNNRIRDVLSFQQRRILDAFPHFDSTLYEEALSRLRKLNSDSRRNIIIERKSQIPEKQKSRSARKKARQKATERARAKRRN